MNIEEAMTEIDEKLGESDRQLKKALTKENRKYYRGRADAFLYSLKVLDDIIIHTGKTRC